MNFRALEHLARGGTEGKAGEWMLDDRMRILEGYAGMLDGGMGLLDNRTRTLEGTPGKQ